MTPMENPLFERARQKLVSKGAKKYDNHCHFSKNEKKRPQQPAKNVVESCSLGRSDTLYPYCPCLDRQQNPVTEVKEVIGM